jgi:nitrogen fixation-related uncharacterized protein
VKILVHNGQYDDEYWLADTKDRIRAALSILFTKLDKMGCYDENVKHLELARSGNYPAMRGILESRRNCEYEGWAIVEVSDPLTPK